MPRSIPELDKLIRNLKISKILNEKSIWKIRGDSKLFRFKKGKLFLGKVEGIFTGMYIFAIFNKLMGSWYPKNYKEDIYKIGEFQGKKHVLNFNLKNKNLTETILNRHLSTLRYYGFGDFTLVRGSFKTDSLRVKNYPCPYAEQYSRFFGKQEKPIDFFISGLLNGFFSEYLKRNVKQ